MTTRSPVLFLVFNRPDPTARVFAAIREARPPRLYVAADGPRNDRPGEAARCEEARRIATRVDWPCEVHTLFRGRNLGCRRAVSEAIDWFFEAEPEGIILEDDCLPHPSFFPYVDELLERYRGDSRVMSVTGINIHRSPMPTEYSYVYSRFSLMWGWATWRRAWRMYDASMASWPRVRNTKWLQLIGSGSRLFRMLWTRILDRTYAGEIDTWDYQWIYTCWRENGLTAVPATNLVRNIGFDADATHTRNENHTLADLAVDAMAFPLNHPPDIEMSYDVDRYIARRWFGISWRAYLRQGVYGRIGRALRFVGSIAAAVFRGGPGLTPGGRDAGRSAP